MSLVEHQFEEKQERNPLSRDAEKLLELAEKLQDRCEGFDRRIFFTSVFGTFVTIGVAGVGIFLLLFDSPEPRIAMLFSVLLFLYSAMLFATCIILRNMSLILYRREKRALQSIVDMLREIDQAITHDGEMSAIERAEFKIRLARFDIGSTDKQ